MTIFCQSPQALRISAFALAIGLFGCSNETQFKGSSGPAIERNSSAAGDQTSEPSENDAASPAPLQDFDAKITLTRDDVPRSVDYQQGIRANKSYEFLQGFLGTSATTQFVQDTPKLDIVVVVDNSGSMGNEQAKLAPQLSPLIGLVNNSDWQIGLISTDDRDACLRKLVRKSDATAADDFSAAVIAMGTGGSSSEKGVKMGHRALTCKTDGSFPRDGASIAVLIVSDEDNCSQGQCADPAETDGSLLLNELNKTTKGRTLGVNSRLYGIISHPSRPCTTAANIGNKYAQFITQSNGEYGDICDNDYSQALNRISKDISETLKSRITLPSPPDAGTVTISGIDSAFTIDGTTIILATTPPPGTTVNVSYRTGGQPVRQEFPFDNWIEGRQVTATKVTINDTIILPSQYELDLAKKTIKFATTPPERSQVKVALLQTDDKTLIKDTFLASKKMDPSSVRILVDGQPTIEFRLIMETGEVQLAKTPSDGSFVRIDFTESDGPQLTYEVDGDMIITAVDDTTGKPVSATLKDHKVTFAPETFEKGRVIRLRLRKF